MAQGFRKASAKRRAGSAAWSGCRATTSLLEAQRAQRRRVSLIGFKAGAALQLRMLSLASAASRPHSRSSSCALAQPCAKNRRARARAASAYLRHFAACFFLQSFCPRF